MRVMTADGFDERGVHLTDPGQATWQISPWAGFMARGNVIDGMGLSVHGPYWFQGSRQRA